MIKTVYYIEVPFYDVDSMGIVWHGNYIAGKMRYADKNRIYVYGYV